MKGKPNDIQNKLQQKQIYLSKQVSIWSKLCPCFYNKSKIKNGYSQQEERNQSQEQHQQTNSNFPISQNTDFISIGYLQKKNTDYSNFLKKDSKQINENLQKKKANQTDYSAFNEFNSKQKNIYQQNLLKMNFHQQGYQPKDFNEQDYLSKGKNTQSYSQYYANKSFIQSQYSVNKLEQNKLMVLGNIKSRLLCKIQTIEINPYPSSIQKQKQSIKNQKKNKKKKLNQIMDRQLDKYWQKRYFLFQKFDQGIKLDKQSWYSVTPQAVADYLASKIKFNGVILDGFCGAGGDAIKLAFASKKVIANDIDPNKIQCLINNAKIYGAQNIQFNCQDFFNFTQKVDAVYLAPPWGGPQYFQRVDFFPQDFVPPLGQIFKKSLTLSNNLFFLLPANVNVEQLSACLSFQLLQSKQIYSTCTLKIQKIYFKGRLKFIAGYFGDLIQNQIKINEQLDLIYNILRSPDEGIFKHKKVIRKLRQQYGMIQLLNMIFQCQKQFSLKFNFQQNEQKSLMDFFYEYILQQNLITQQKLIKLKEQQQFEYQSQKQKYKQKKQKKIKKAAERKQIKKQDHQNQIKLQNYQKLQNNKQSNISQKCQIQDTQIHKNLQNSKSLKGSFDLNQIANSKKSKISSLRQSDLQNTLSYVSQLTEDQLRQAMLTSNYNRPESQYSIRQSLDYFKRYDTLQASGQLKKSQNNNRFSSPLYLSPKKQNISPKKENMEKKQCSYWEEGIQQIQQEKDFQQS